MSQSLNEETWKFFSEWSSDAIEADGELGRERVEQRDVKWEPTFSKLSEQGFVFLRGVGWTFFLFIELLWEISEVPKGDEDFVLLPEF